MKWDWKFTINYSIKKIDYLKKALVFLEKEAACLGYYEVGVCRFAIFLHLATPRLLAHLRSREGVPLPPARGLLVASRSHCSSLT